MAKIKGGNNPQTQSKEKREDIKPQVAKQESFNNNYPVSGCPHCHGTRSVQAPAAPGFEGRPTFPMPCPYCK